MNLITLGLILSAGLAMNNSTINTNTSVLLSDEATEEVSDNITTEDTSGDITTDDTNVSDDVSGDTTTEEFDIGEFLSQYFTAETITSILSVLTSLAVVIKLALTLRDIAKQKSVSAQEVCDKVTEVLRETNEEEVEKAINELLTPLQSKIDTITPVLNSFAKILALSQENTAESKLAILELLQSIGNVSNEIIEEAKSEVESQKAKEEENKQSQINTLNSISVKASTPVE